MSTYATISKFPGEKRRRRHLGTRSKDLGYADKTSRKALIEGAKK
jgi:hypothetical protein